MSNQRSEAGAERLPRVGVVLAGGTGIRVGLKMPKQLVKVAGKPLLEHTLAAFESSEAIDEVIVLMAPGWADEAHALVGKAGFAKVTAILEGGETRNDTTRKALAAIAERADEAKVLFHDAVRPLLDERIIADCVRALDDYAAVDTAIPSADTIVTVNDQEVITDIPSRNRLRRGQTPQGFLLSTITRAYEKAAEDPDFAATDDCGVILRYQPHVPITVVEGSEQNMKVTYPIDVFLADQLFRMGSHQPPSPVDEQQAKDQLTGRTLVVFGGSYGIGAEIAEAAESLGATVFCHSRSTTGIHVEDPAEVRQAMQTAYEASGRIDYVVVTAGVLHLAQLTEADDAAVDDSIGVNLLGPIHIARAAHQYLAESSGQLLLFTSSSYTRGRGGYSLYSATKAAVVNLTQALADEWSPDGIRVNCVNPERTGTPMRTKAFGEESPESLLPARTVGLTSLDVLLGDGTGHVIDIRREAMAPTYDPVNPVDEPNPTGDGGGEPLGAEDGANPESARGE